MEVDGARPRKTWLEVVKNDVKGLQLASAVCVKCETLWTCHVF